MSADPEPAQAHALFEALPDGRFLPTEFSRGPWSPDALHGGPVAALVTGAAEGHEVDRSNPMQVARLTLELLRPVPLEPLSLSLRTARRGRKVQLIEVGISAGVREVARALVLRARQSPLELPPLPNDGSTATGGAVPVPGPQDARRQEPDHLWTAFHNSAMDLRYVAGGWLSSGPATVWFRLTCPVVDGWPVTPAMRAAAAADFGNGIMPSCRSRSGRSSIPISRCTSTGRRWANGSAWTRRRPCARKPAWGWRNRRSLTSTGRSAGRCKRW